MLIYTRRDAHEVETSGDDYRVGPGRTAANPQDTTADNLLAKFVATPNEAHTIRITAERFTSDSHTDILSLNAVTPRTSALSGDDDEMKRMRVSLDHEYRQPANGLLSEIHWTLYFHSLTPEHSEETRINTTAGCSGITSGVNTCCIPREFMFEQDVSGANVQTVSLFNQGDATHQLIYGIDYALTNTLSLRDATVMNLTTGR